MAESSKAEGDKKQFKTLDRRNGSKRLSLRHFLNRTPFRPNRSYSAEETHSISEKSVPLRQESTATTVPKSIKSSKLLECPLCLNFLPKDSFPEVFTCDHRSCVECLRQYLRIEISESRVNIACPECSEKFHPNDIRDILSDKKLYDKYEDRMLRRVLVSDADTRWCPAPDCGFAVIAAGCASCPKIRCERPGCGTSFCYHCKSFWHPNQTCDSARAERNRPFNRHESRWVLKEDVKCCPKCQALIIKMEDGSCNHMTCSVCGAEFCWLCMKEISDLHYLSPSGCTFWGKKPWSRKKKILWQLGTLVGAPVGIGLIAGLAVPAMLIGIPVWVGRKVHNKYSNLPKGRKNALVTASVAASVLVSPVLAGLAVGIGVPILLAYVYGVVPVSLCRSGGCGLTTTDNGGVRIDLRDDEAVAGATHSEKVNPDKKSIGPSIGEMSLGLNGSLSVSGSQMEKIGVRIDESDRESASHKAVAGGSITGSVSASTTNKLEVQADISIVTPSNQPTTAKRASLSSESNKSAMDHEASSTKGLAGSLYSTEMERRSSPISHRSASLDETTKVGKRKVGSDGDRVSVNSWDDDNLKRNKRRSPSDDSCVLPEVEPSIVVRRVTLIEEESSSRQNSASSRL